MTDLEGFWRSIWDYFDVRSQTPFERVLKDRRMPGAEWFCGASVNYVDQVFRHSDVSRPAIVYRGETGFEGEISWVELEHQVAGMAASLRSFGVVPGDRVVAYLPNVPQAIVAFLAAASVGAIWSICAPDMGSVSVLDRFRQIEPKILIASDGYRFGGRAFDRRDVVATLVAELNSVETLILVPLLDPHASVPVDRSTHLFDELTRGRTPLRYEWLPFDHPLWVVYSSGTTGMPKPIVHGHGGVLLESLKGVVLHNDIGPNDRFNWYSSTGWIMWNYQVGGLLAGATLCLYDGNPAWPDWTRLWRFVSDTKTTVFGAGAAFFSSCMKAGVIVRDIADLSRLRALGSTGSPLAPESYRWIYAHVRSDIWLASIAGGTDFAGGFWVGNITLPIYIGQMQCRSLGAAVYAFNEAGQAVEDEVGELVCTEPLPSMPLYFWNDPENRRYQESYFDMYPGVWRHGDWLRITRQRGGIIYGRSDATINRHGVRMGTSEIYRIVEALSYVEDSIVVDLEYLGRESYMALFVVMRDGQRLSRVLEDEIKGAIRVGLSARHVPNEIFQIAQVPRTLSGKKLEVPIKKLLLGQSAERAVSRDSMVNPDSLDWFIQLATQRTHQDAKS